MNAESGLLTNKGKPLFCVQIHSYPINQSQNRKEILYMAQTKIEKIASIEEKIKQLKERQKLLQQQHNAQERKDRTKRLCKRMGLLENLLPNAVILTDEQFKSFLEKTIITEPSRRILDELTAQNAATLTPQGAGSAAHIITPPATKPAEMEQNEDTGESEERGNGARVTG